MAAGVALGFHTRVAQSALQLRFKRSSLNGTVSSHVCPETVTFAQLLQFQKIAEAERCAASSFIGTIAGDLILSVNPGRAPASVSKKRRASTSADEAARAIGRIKRGVQEVGQITEASYSLAEATLARLLELKSPTEEAVIESWALSVRRYGTYGAANTPDKRPSLVVAIRVAAGAAVPASQLVEVLKQCTDGMITTCNENIHQDLDLPLTAQGKEAQSRGQKSVLLLASVPHVPDPLAAAPQASRTDHHTDPLLPAAS